MTTLEKPFVLPNLEASEKKDIKKFNETGSLPNGLLRRFDQHGRFRYYIDRYDTQSDALNQLIPKIRQHQLSPEEISSKNEKGERVLHTGLYENNAETISGDWDIIEGPIHVTCKEVSLPNVKRFLSLSGKEIEKIEIPQLRECYSLYMPDIRELHLPELEIIRGQLQTLGVSNLFAPKLKTVDSDISCRGTEGINLDSLEKVANLIILPLKSTIDLVSLPKLTTARELSLRHVKEFYAPAIKDLSLGILGTSLEKITIPDEIPFTKLEVPEALFSILREERRQRKAAALK